MCVDRALEALDSLGPDPVDVAEIVVRCDPGPCTPTTGDGQTTVTLADGQRIGLDWSYRGGP